jgi:hypothetical protein
MAPAQVKAVLSAALEKLALIGVINVDPAAQAQALTESVGDEIGRMISAQQQLERRFEELVAAQHELRGQPNKIKLQENEARGFCSSQGRDLPGGSSSVPWAQALQPRLRAGSCRHRGGLAGSD